MTGCHYSGTLPLLPQRTSERQRVKITEMSDMQSILNCKTRGTLSASAVVGLMVSATVLLCIVLF